MNKRIDSRTTEIDIETCVENSGGRYSLIIAASQRLRELRRQHKEGGRYVTTIDALKDIESGSLNVRDYLVKVK